MRYPAVFTLLLVALAALAQTTAPGSGPFDKSTVKSISGEWKFLNNPKTMGGVLCENAVVVSKYATFDIRGWTLFTANIGINDEAPKKTTGEMIIEVDGQEVWKGIVSYGQKPVAVTIGLTGAKTLTLRCPKGFLIFGPEARGTDFLFGDAKLSKEVMPSLEERLIKILIDLRAAALQQKDQAAADSIVARLLDAGVVLEEKDGVTTWRLK